MKAAEIISQNIDFAEKSLSYNYFLKALSVTAFLDAYLILNHQIAINKITTANLLKFFDLGSSLVLFLLFSFISSKGLSYIYSFMWELMLPIIVRISIFLTKKVSILLQRERTMLVYIV